MLAGWLRRGSGMIGSGGVCVVPVVAGPRSDALSCSARFFGAGFGIGTFCAKDGAAIRPMAITIAGPMRRPRLAGCSVIGNFVSLCKRFALSGWGPFYRDLGPAGYRFSVRI